MLSLRELKRAAAILNHKLAGARIQKIGQPDDYRLALSLYGPAVREVVLFSCRPEFARVSVLVKMPQAPAVPSSFVQYLRAHLGRARFDGVRVGGADRHLRLRFQARDGVFEIILSILGSRSNVYLTDGGGRLLGTLRPLQATRRELAMGELWKEPDGDLRTEGVDRWAEISDEGYLAEIERSYGCSEKRREVELLTRKMEQALSKESSFLARKAANLLEDLGEAVRAQEHMRKGELLKGLLHTIPPGAGSVTATDYETGEEVVIPLDTRLSAAENLEAYFRRYRRDVRGSEAIRRQLCLVEEKQRGLEDLTTELDRLLRIGEPDLEALRDLAARPGMRSLLGRHHPDRKDARPRARMPGGKRGVPGRLLPRRFRTEQGLEIWVGRSDEGNDYLTTRLARGNDLFFHLEEYPGSHVILRTEAGREPSPESLLDACELAVHFSKLKSSNRAEVHVSPVKNIRKPKGAKPGLVYVSRGKTIHLRRDPARLQNILASRLDD